MRSFRKITGWAAAFVAALMWIAPAPAPAAVEITFYSRDMGSQFPHGFVTLAGTPDRGGDRIDTGYGFTATHVTPALLFGSVRGAVEPVEPSYVRASEAHFSLVMSDSEYDAVTATIERWRELRQPSYNLNRRNCVHFVADVAVTLGMQAEVPRNVARRPGAFTASLIRANRQWLEQRGGTILREPAPERRRRGDDRP